MELKIQHKPAERGKTFLIAGRLFNLFVRSEQLNN